MTTKRPYGLTRRSALTAIGAGAATLASPAYLRAQSSKTIRVGYVTPTTGPLGAFGETDTYSLDWFRALTGNTIDVGGETYNLEIVVRDSQSNPNRAAEMAGELLLNEEVHLIVPASTTDTAMPVCEQAELFATPCISTMAPWQAVVFPRGGPDAVFDWTYHFFWGLEDIVQTFVNIWDTVETNRKVGLILPNTTDGEVWGDANIGLPPAMTAAGLEVITPSFYEPRTNDYSSQISVFKDEGCDIIGGLVFPADLKTLLNQCAQQNYKPPVATIAAGLLFASNVESIGNLALGTTTEVWWTPAFPYQSSLTGQTSRDVANEWEVKTGKQWTQPLGYSHAVWEVVSDVLKRSGDPMDRAANRDSLKATDLQTLCGRVKFDGAVHPNVSKTPILGGQWVKGEKWPYDLKIIETQLYPIMEPEGSVGPLPWEA